MAREQFVKVTVGLGLLTGLVHWIALGELGTILLAATVLFGRLTIVEEWQHGDSLMGQCL